MFQKKEKTLLSQYQDTTDSLSNKNLQRGYWFVQHREQLRQIVIVLLLIFCVVTVGYSLFMWGKYISVDYFRDRDLYALQTREIENYEALQPRYQAIPLQYAGSKIFESAEDKFDFMTPVTNLNERFIAYVTYHYTFQNEKTASHTLKIFPKRSHVLAHFGFDTTSFPSGAQLVIEHIQWEKINPHQIPNVAEVIDERLNFSVDAVEFQSPSAADGISTTGVSFQITNETLFSYWDPVFYVTLERGNDIVGVLPIMFDTIGRQETKDVNIRLISRVSSVDNVRVYPIIDIFDPSVYIPLSTGQ